MSAAEKQAIEGAKCVTVRVPATTANLGPGFDCLGLALDLWNEASFRLQGAGLCVEFSGESSADLPRDEQNMIFRGWHAFCQARGLAMPPGLLVRCNNAVPVSSGLGSSASAALLGLLGASAAYGQRLTDEEALAMAGALEGHADNAAAALLGGLVLIAAQNGGWLARKVEIPTLRLAVVLPAFHLPTHAARAALPAQVAMKDATYNLGRAALVVEALRSADLDLLGQVIEDRLHQPYRLPLIPGAVQAVAAGRAAGAAVALSGAGPSLIAFTPGDPGPAAAAMQAAFAQAGLPSRAFLLKTTLLGAHAVL
jgi:homoserine kinase